MDNELNNPTLTNKKIRSSTVRRDPKDYHDFLELLYEDIDFAIRELSKYRDICCQGIANDTNQGEDLINVIICIILTARGWKADHDTSINGHADIVVTIPFNDKYHWLGEGKIYGGKAYSSKGFKQLAHRYSTGLDGQTAGGMLIYIDSTNKNQLTILNDWKKTLEEMDEKVLDDNTMPLSKATKLYDCTKNSLSFFSEHTHPSSGLIYTIRHSTIDFRHQPKDVTVKKESRKRGRPKKSPT